MIDKVPKLARYVKRDKFIDRDPKIFMLMLDYVRNSFEPINIEDSTDKKLYEKELIFWGLLDAQPIEKKKKAKLKINREDELHIGKMRKMFEQPIKFCKDDIFSKYGPFDIKEAVKMNQNLDWLPESAKIFKGKHNVKEWTI